MQFKSILAVLALTVAVIATPIEPAAVNLNPAILVKRTTPQQVCTAAGKNLVPTTCTNSSGAVSPSGLIAILSGTIENLLAILTLRCVISGNTVLSDSSTTVLCCDNSGNSNTQAGNLVAINNQNSCSVQKVV